MANEHSDRFNIPDIPLLLEIEPTSTCNLRCVMCHVRTQDNSKPVYLDIDVLSRRTEEIKNCHVILGSEYEPTIHPQFEKLLRLIIKRNWKIDFLSNGVTLHMIDQGLLSDVPFHVYNASFDGFSEKAFSKIRLGANYYKVKQNVLEVAALSKKNGAVTAINATMLKSNLYETKDLIKMWDAEEFDLVRLLVMQARDTADHILKESLYPERFNVISTLDDVADMVLEEQLKIGVRCGYYGSKTFSPPKNLNIHQDTIYSDNPDFNHVPKVRQDLQKGPWPGMSVPCKSPFVYCRIRWDGMVDLCNNRNNIVGNIYTDTLSNIWHGDEAVAVRKKIMCNKYMCENCEYFRFCIGISQQDILNKKSHFANGVLSKPEVTKFIEQSDIYSP